MDFSTATATAPEPEGADEPGQHHDHHHHNTHALPPKFIQKRHWHYQQIKRSALDQDEDVIDFARGLSELQKSILKPVETVSKLTVRAASAAYRTAYFGDERVDEVLDGGGGDVTVYGHEEFPGMYS